MNFAYQGQPHNFIILPQGYIISPALCQHLVHRALDCHSLPQGTTVAYCIDYAVVIGPRESEIAIILDLLLRHLNVREWEVDLIKILGPSILAEFLEIWWCEACQDIPSKVKDKLLHLTHHLTTGKETQIQISLNFRGAVCLIWVC